MGITANAYATNSSGKWIVYDENNKELWKFSGRISALDCMSAIKFARMIEDMREVEQDKLLDKCFENNKVLKTRNKEYLEKIEVLSRKLQLLMEQLD